MSKNKRKPEDKTQDAVNNTTKKNTTNKKNQQKNANENGGKKKLSNNQIALIATIAAVLVIAITVGVVLIVDYVKNDKGFNYLKSDLSKYVEFTEDYKNLSFSLDIAKPRDIDVDNAILAILASNRSENPIKGSVENKIYDPSVIGVGDRVFIWYQGYVLDSNGEKTYVPELSNLTGNQAGQLDVGGGKMYPGIELGMVGKNTGDYPKFEKITEGKVSVVANSGDCVVYVSYTRFISEGESTEVKKETKTNERIDLSTDIDAVYGSEFKALLMKAMIGESKFDLKTSIGDKKYEYTGVKVSFATTCEYSYPEELVFKGYIPYDEGNDTYRNRDVYFNIYFDGFVDYDAPTELTDEIVDKKHKDNTLGITLEELDEYEGSTKAEKYRNYVASVVNDVYEADYDVLLKEAIWTHLLKISTIKKYPVQELKETYEKYVRDINYRFAETGGVLTDSTTGSQKTYQTVDAYATAYYNLTNSSVTWTDYLYILAQNKVKERLVMFYLMREENLLPTDAEFDAEYNANVQMYLDQYVSESLNYEGIDKDSLSEEEYAKYVETCKVELFAIYSESDFKDMSYYMLLINELRDWDSIKVTTLDDGTNIPQDK